MVVLAACPLLAACEILSGLSSLEEAPADGGVLPSGDGSDSSSGSSGSSGSGSSGSSGSSGGLEAGSDAGDGGIVIGPGPFNVTVSITGTNRGVVTSSPTGIDCYSALPDANPAPKCTASFEGGTLVDLNTTVPEAFSWGGDCADAADNTLCELLMDSSKAVVASYSSY
jgi:hypothetical protein